MPGHSHSTELISCTTVLTCFDKDAISWFNKYLLTNYKHDKNVCPSNWLFWTKHSRALKKKYVVILFRHFGFHFAISLNLHNDRMEMCCWINLQKATRSLEEFSLYVILFNVTIGKHKEVDINDKCNAWLKDL